MAYFKPEFTILHDEFMEAQRTTFIKGFKAHKNDFLLIGAFTIEQAFLYFYFNSRIKAFHEHLLDWCMESEKIPPSKGIFPKELPGFIKVTNAPYYTINNKEITIEMYISVLFLYSSTRILEVTKEELGDVYKTYKNLCEDYMYILNHLPRFIIKKDGMIHIPDLPDCFIPLIPKGVTYIAHSRKRTPLISKDDCKKMEEILNRTLPYKVLFPV